MVVSSLSPKPEYHVKVLSVVKFLLFAILKRTLCHCYVARTMIKGLIKVGKFQIPSNFLLC